MTKLIPFWFWPGSWGLRGTSREIARIEYVYSNKPETCERMVSSVRYAPDTHDYKLDAIRIDEKYGHATFYEASKRRLELNHVGVELDLALNALDRDHNLITERKFKERQAELTLTGAEYEVALVQIAYDNGDITDIEAEKQVATINGEAWVKVIGEQTDSGVPDTLGLEIAYNNLFIDHLIDQGYSGNEDQIINEWFIELSKQIAADEFPQMAGTKSTVIDNTGDTRRYE